MATNVDLLGSYWTLAGAAEPHTDKDYSPFDFKDRVEAAARAGFKGIGIWHSDLAHTLKKRSLKEMKQIFDDNGIKHIELEFLTGWFLDGEEKKQSDIARKMLLTAAELLDGAGVPSRAAIRAHLSGNYCRCTGYQAIVDAVETVARARAGAKP